MYNLSMTIAAVKDVLPEHKAYNRTAIGQQTVQKMWVPRPLGFLWTSKSC
jgi:hypothetical protein